MYAGLSKYFPTSYTTYGTAYRDFAELGMFAEMMDAGLAEVWVGRVEADDAVEGLEGQIARLGIDEGK